MFDPAVARTYASRMTESQIQALQDTCLDVHANGGEVSVSSGSGSITVNLSNCVSILENLEEALRIIAAGTADPDLTAPAFTTGVNFAGRYID